jgi:hypothetical protein
MGGRVAPLERVMQTALARILFYRREDHVPGTDYLTQNSGIEQTIVGHGYSRWQSRNHAGREKTAPRLSHRSAKPMKQIVNDDWTVGSATATV